MSGVNFRTIYRGKLKTAALILAVTGGFGAVTVSAQSINDDLKPVAKPSSTIKTPAKTVKKTGSRSEKKTGGASSKSQKGVRSGTAVAASFSETPDQIINRFMNFQQSAGVTARDWNSVIAQTDRTLRDNPNHSVAKAQSLIAQGQLAYNRNKYAIAVTHFKNALQILPASSVLHYSLGRAYLANGQAKAAEKSFKTAIDQNEDFALAYKGLGDAFVAQGEQKTAVKYFKKATEASVKDGNMNP